MDTLIGLMQNPVVLLGVGMLVKYFPKVRELIANKAIPYINVALAFLGALLALATGAVGEVIKPAMFASWSPEQATIVAAGFGGAFGGLFVALKAAIWNAGAAYIMNKLLVNQVASNPPDSKR